MPNSKPRPEHSVTYNGQHRKAISTVSIVRRLTATHVLITRLGATAATVQRTVPHDQYRTYIPTKNSKSGPDHRVSYAVHYCTKIIIVAIFRCQTAKHLRTTQLGAIGITVHGSVPYLSPDAQQQPSFRSLGWVQILLPYRDQHRTYPPKPNGEQRPTRRVS